LYLFVITGTNRVVSYWDDNQSATASGYLTRPNLLSTV